MTNLVTFGNGLYFRAYTAQKHDLGVETSWDCTTNPNTLINKKSECFVSEYFEIQNILLFFVE